MENTFRVGYGRRTVTPTEPIPLAGFSNELQRFHTRVTEPICVTCVALTDAEDNTVLMVGADICTAGKVAIMGRERISKITGIDETKIYISATHTHSAPGLGKQELPCIQRYTEQMMVAYEEAAMEALADRKTAQMFIGSIETENLNFIKHYKVRDTTTGEISYIGDQYGTAEGKVILDHATRVDPTLHLVKFVREGGKDVVIANFRAHPHFTGGYKKYDLSSDYIGAFRMALEAMYDCNCVYFQGACGNVNSSTRIVGEKKFTNCRSHGMALAATALEGLTRYMSPVEPGTIRTKQVTVFGKINHSNDHLIEQAKEIVALWKETYSKSLCVEKAAPYGLHGPYHASATVANYSRTDEEDGKLILNAVAIGDHFAFVTYPGEMFDSISVRIEENSPFDHTLLLGYCYHHAGYLPSAAAYKYGSYEVDVTRFQCGMGETVADTYHEMLKELK